MTDPVTFRTAIPAHFAQADDAASHALAQKCINHLDRFANIPGLLSKLPKLTPYAPLGPGILSFLESLRYKHHDGDETTYNYTNPHFWGLICVTLLNPDCKLPLLRGLITAGPTLPRWPEQQHILHRCVTAIHPLGPTGPAEFDALASTLAADCEQSLSNCDASRWADTLGIKTNGHDWAVRITLPGSHAPGNSLSFELRPDATDSWQIRIQTAGGGRYSEIPTRVLQDTLGISPLSERGLSRFPSWVMDLEQDFDLHRATIQITKLRAAAKPIKAWLAT